MASKLEFYSQLSREAAVNATSSYPQWLSLLQSMGRFYKYPFHEQLMIHTQRPGATACASYEIWNQKMGRYVRQGSKGIAIIDNSGDHARVRYLFDVADTAAMEHSRTPNIWTYREEHEQAVREDLSAHFDVGGITLADQLEETARFVVDDYWYANRQDILDNIAGSMLMDYDEDTIRQNFCESAAVSTGYLLLSRCGLNPDSRYQPVDFLGVFDFNTPGSVQALGSAASVVSEQILRQIELTVRQYDREKASERSQNNELTELHSERGISGPGPAAGGSEQGTPGQVREAAEDVPGGTQTSDLEHHDPERDSVRTPSGDRQGGPEASGTDDAQAPGRSRTDRGTEGKRASGLDPADEQSESAGRGNDPERTDLHLTGKSQDDQVSFFPSESDQITYITQAETTTVVASAFTVPQAVIDEILRTGSNTENHRQAIVAEFSKNKPVDTQVEFLKRVYHGANGLEIDGVQYAAWYADNGIHLRRGNSARYERTSQILSWQDASGRINELLDKGSFASNVEIAEAPSFERKELAEKLWYLASDLSETGFQQDLLPSIRNLSGGFPAETAILADRLKDTVSLNALHDEMTAFMDAYSENKGILRFHYHKPNYLLTALEEQQLPRTDFHSVLMEISAVQGFITEDELNASFMRGSGVAGGKDRIVDYLTSDHTSKEKAEFLRKEYGIGGRSHALSDARGSEESHDGKGMEFRKDGCESIHLSWEKTARRLDEIIQKGRYLSKEEQDKRDAIQSVNEEPDVEDIVVDGSEIRDRLADRGIVNGQVVDPAKLDADPFIRQVMSDAASTANQDPILQLAEEMDNFSHDIDTAKYHERVSDRKAEQEKLASEIRSGNPVEIQSFLTSVLAGPDAALAEQAFHLEEKLIELTPKIYKVVPNEYSHSELDRSQVQAFRFGIEEREIFGSGRTEKCEYYVSALTAGSITEEQVAQELRDNADRWHCYIIPDLSTWNPMVTGDRERTPIEYFDSYEESADRFRELRTQEYNANPVLNPETQEPLAQLTIGIQRENPPGAADLLQVRNGKNYLVDDFTRMTAVNTSEEAMKILRRMNEELGFDRIRRYEKDAEGIYLPPMDMAFSEWENSYFPRQAEQRLLSLDQDRLLHIQTCDAGYDYTIYDAGNSTSIDGGTLTAPDISMASAVREIGQIHHLDTQNTQNLPLERLEDLIIRENNREFAQRELIPGETTFQWEGRTFLVDRVNLEFDSVNLQDITFVQNAGFPIFRTEHISTVRQYLESLPEDPVVEVIQEPVHAEKPENFHIIDAHLGEGTPRAKFTDNLKAIQLLYQLQIEDRYATPDEQEVLSRYVGWGGLSEVFDESKTSWAKERQQFQDAVSPEEYTAARASTLNAHYTSPTVIRAIYEAVENMGFQSGNILEPSCGVGNFLGMLPPTMEGSRLYGVELDPLSGRIAQELYPRADITIGGFETTDRRDFFDIVIGNVPFGQYKVNDPAYNKLNFNIHNYFLAKSLDQVRPGGVVAVVTTRYTMDSKDSTVRRYLAQRAELLGAIRLPDNAFQKNAGAEVVSDILFLQRRERPLEIAPDWTQTAPNEQGYAINRYFVDHPEMVLGHAGERSTAHGMDYTVTADDSVLLADRLHEAVQHIGGTYLEAEILDLGENQVIDTSIPADPNVKNYSYTVVDNLVYYRENSRMVRPEISQTAEARIKGMIRLRDCVHDLITMELDADTSDAAIHDQQKQLNTLYDSYTAKYGLINDKSNKRAMADDSSYYLLCALEVLDEDRKLKRKADMFTVRTIRPHQVVTSVETASEALSVSMSEKARVDLDYMAQLSGKTREQIIEDLTGVIFEIPESDGVYVTSDEYLSGNVRQKLREAQAAAAMNSAYQVNVEALTAAQPKDLTASEIEVRLGATWINKEYIQQFMFETFQTPWYLQRSIKVNYAPQTAEWQVEGKSNVSYNDVAAYTTYGTDRANAYKILEDSLNLRDVRVYDTIEEPDGRTRRVLNSRETTLAAQKQQAIREEFQSWIWQDPQRRHDLERQYNEEMNSIRPRQYDGSHLVFAGMNPEITLRPHQRNAIAHIILGGNTLLAHQVGAGKTYEIVGACMESKRLGLCTKSLIAVPNHLTEQWASEFLTLYPSANILVATKKDFEPARRKKFVSRIATGDYDAIIIGHSQFEKIPISKERQERQLQEQIDEITEGISEARYSSGERFTVKQLEKTKKSLEQRLEKLQAEDRKDDVITFEELGVDRLFVDEAHSFKNLFLYTKMRNVAGLSTTDAQKSSDMFAKCRYMDEITGGKGVVFATGTPVSNSMTELYTMQRYLQYDRLKELNMVHFDCWASRFGETVTALELAPEGTGYRARTRFSKFYNLPELMNLFKETADIKTADQLHLPTPKVEYHTVVAKPTEYQQEMVQALSERAAEVHNGSVDPSEDNMLKITSDGRKLGLDQRTLNPMLPDEPGTKVNQCVENVMRIWKDGQEEKLTQLIFCDLSTPKTTKAPKAAKGVENLDGYSGFCVYDDIRSKLIAQGIPPEQIAFIHDANTEQKKADLFSKVRSGHVRVLMGSTSKMGAGMNVQDRLAALHDLDCPWRPGDLEQRKGRIERQGNMNEKVEVFRYVTEGTFDSYLWQTIENKQRFISQVMTSKSPVRSCEDIDETALSYAEIKALCAGDPRVKERMDLDVEVTKLKLMKADHQSKQFKLEDQLLRSFPEQIQQDRISLKGMEKDMETLTAHPLPESGFVGLEIRGDHLVDKENAGAALLNACKEIRSNVPQEIGSYRGFTVQAAFDSFRKEYDLYLRGQMSHRVILGSDARGNLIRMDNALASMPDRSNAIQAHLDNLLKQQDAARIEIKKPFPHEEKLKVMSARLTELNILLDMNAHHGEPEQAEGLPEKAAYSRLSKEKHKPKKKKRSRDLER